MSRSKKFGFPLAILLVLSVLLAGSQFYRAGANWDLAWLTYVAEEWVAGADLYTDYLETNPPLPIWLLTPAVPIARWIGTPPVHLVGLLVTALGLLSLSLSDRLLERAPRVAREERFVFLAVLAASFFILPVGDYGQREHIQAMLFLPYILLAGLRETGNASDAAEWISRRAAVLVGVTAGVGIGMKPFFAVGLIAVEGWLAARERSAAVLRRPETIAATVVLAAYPVAVLVFEPDYLELLRDLIFPLYGRFVWRSPVEAFAGLTGVLALLAVVVVFATPLKEPWRSIGRATVIAAIAWVGTAFLQGKGFSYHFLPVEMASVIAIGSASVGAHVGGASVRWDLGTVGRCGIIAVTIFGATEGMASNTLRRNLVPGHPIRTLTALLRAQGPSPRVAALTGEMGPVFPVVNYAEARWSLRHPTTWALASAIQWDESTAQAQDGGRGGEPPRRISSMEDRIRDQFVRDLVESEPDVVLIREPPTHLFPGGFEYLEYFSRSEDFRAFAASYRFLGKLGSYLIYVSS